MTSLMRRAPTVTLLVLFILSALGMSLAHDAWSRNAEVAIEHTAPTAMFAALEKAEKNSSGSRDAE